MSVIQFVPRDTRTDKEKYRAAVAEQTGYEQEDPRCDTHWRVTLEREFWPSNEEPHFYESEQDANDVALMIGKGLGGVIDVIPPGWNFPERTG